MKKIFTTYFIILFLILASYLVYSLPANSVRLHIATADQLSYEHENWMSIWVRDIRNGSQFSGYTIESYWIDENGEQDSDKVSQPLPENGEIAMAMPKIYEWDEPDGLEVVLVDSDGQIQKSGIVPMSTFQKERLKAVNQWSSSERPEFRALAPASFVRDQPNEVFLVYEKDGSPGHGEFWIEQTYGQKADFPKKAKVDGVTRIMVTLNSPVDLKFRTGAHEYYETFVPDEKTIHVEIDEPVMMPKHYPTIHVTPVGSMMDLTVDYFDDEAWIGRQVIPASENGVAELKIDLDDDFYLYNNVIYARVSSSAIATPESSQTFAIVLDNIDNEKGNAFYQAALALRALKKIVPGDAENLENLSYHTVTGKVIRDYALLELVDMHSPSIEMRVRTEEDEARIFEQEKAVQKSVMNVILVIWFGLGTLASLIWVIRNRTERRRKWRAILASGRADVGDVPPQSSALMTFCFIFLLIGFMVSLYFMMQLI